jgi:hypothetical protein
VSRQLNFEKQQVEQRKRDRRLRKARRRALKRTAGQEPAATVHIAERGPAMG